MRSPYHLLGAAAFFLFTSVWARAQDYRSKASGDWATIATWELSTDGGNTWVNAATWPTYSNSTSITIRAPHTVTLTNIVGSIGIDDLVIEAGATLTNSSDCHGFANGAAAVDISIFGTYNGNSNCGSFGCISGSCGTVSVESGGSIVMGGGVNSAVNFGPLMIQPGGSLLCLPNFRISSPLVNNGTFTVNGAVNLENGATPVNNATMSVGGELLLNSANASFTNNGVLTVTNGDISLQAVNTSFHNNGTLNLDGTANGHFVNNGAGGQSWNNNATGVININSTSLKGIGCCIPFNNAGTFNLNAGQVNQSSVFNNTGALNIASGATFNHYAAGTNTGTISIASGGSLIGSMTPFMGSTLTNNGSVTLASLQFAGTAGQTLAGSGSINGVLQTGTQTVSTALLLTNGKITTGTGDLVLGPSASLTGGNATNYVATTGVGKLVRRVPVNTLTLFPVGTATNYLPVGMTLAPGSVADDYRVRAQADLSSSYDVLGVATGSNVTDHVVARSWFISEANGGGTDATVQFDWNLVEEGAGFDRTNSRVSLYNGGAWDLGPLASASGSGPYSRSRAGLTALGTFAISDHATVFGPDLCPGDPDKNDPGQCGCGNPDTDSDNDLTADCNDGCPNDPSSRPISTTSAISM